MTKILAKKLLNLLFSHMFFYFTLSLIHYYLTGYPLSF